MSGTARRSLTLLMVCGLFLTVVGCGPASSRRSGATATSTLVLYDSTGPYGSLGELYATQAANLASRTGTWTAQPVSRYTAGQVDAHTLTIYIGSTYDERLPATFLADVAAGKASVLWLGANIWQLGRAHPEAANRLGFRADVFDDADADEVQYRNATLTRDGDRAGKLMKITVATPGAVTGLAQAVHADGTTTPWAVRSGRLTYVAEIPFTYVDFGDRYLAFTDILLDLLAPGAPERHRALVRIEDVGPQSDPAQLRAIADYLGGQRVPFAVAVFVRYDDPLGKYSDGRPVHRRLSQAPAVVAALKYMAERGGTLIMNGYAHAYAGGANPYGVSAEDYEFYRARLDAKRAVVLDGPVAEDSAGWALGRLDAARSEWRAAGLPVPDIFQFPHYVASAVDYRAISSQVRARYESAMYFAGGLSGTPRADAASATQFFPYPVRDIYGGAVIPETLGNIELQSFNGREPRLPADMLAAARRQLVVRDGVASFFYHPYLGLDYLPELVEGIRGMGYDFVAADQVISDLPAPSPT
jgi:uncharacterized protein YdaL